MEIETIKKTETHGILEMEILEKRTETSNTNIASRIHEMEERTLGIEETTEETDMLVEENIISKIFMTQNIEQIWDSMERPNIRTIGIERGEESQLQGQRYIFNKMEETLSNLKEVIPKNTEEAYRASFRQYEKKIFCFIIIIKQNKI